MIHSKELINAILGKVTEPYSDWRIGLSENGRHNSEGFIFTMYSLYSKEEISEAYEYFTEKGMEPVYMIGAYPAMLYIFNVKGKKIDAPVITYDRDGMPIQ